MASRRRSRASSVSPWGAPPRREGPPRRRRGRRQPSAGRYGAPSPVQKSRVLGQFAAGEDINRYIQDVNGVGLDATFDSAAGFRAVPAYGWFVAYEQWWCDNWLSNFTYGSNSSDLTDTLPGDTYRRATYVSANLA